MVERSRRAYNDDMTGTAIVAMHVGTMAARGGSPDRPAVVQACAKFSCASCQGDGQDHELVGFCPDCLERSRVIAADDIGGEG